MRLGPRRLDAAERYRLFVPALDLGSRPSTPGRVLATMSRASCASSCGLGTEPPPEPGSDILETVGCTDDAGDPKGIGREARSMRCCRRKGRDFPMRDFDWDQRRLILEPESRGACRACLHRRIRRGRV